MTYSYPERKINNITKLHKKCLEGDHSICSKCDGTGKHPESILSCDKCWGDGILDWVENIMGKECPWNESGLSSSSTSSCSYSSTLPTQKSISEYINNKKKRRKDDHKNFIRRRTVQRFHQMFNKLKRRVQRR